MVIDDQGGACNQFDAQSSLPAELNLLQKFHEIQVATMVAMLRNGLCLPSITQPKVIGSLISLFDTQAASLVYECKSAMGKGHEIS